MNSLSVARRLGTFLVIGITLAGTVLGQGITSSGLSGYVTDKQGKAIGGAAVTVVHEPSGTPASTTSRPNGQYSLSGLRPGGPYTVSVAAPGLPPETRKDIELNLGDAATLNFALGSEIVQMGTFTVASMRDVTFGAGKIGTGTSVSEQDIATVATVRRDIQDVAQLDSRFYLGSLDQGGQLSAQGQNFRFNSLLIDGVQAVDPFGLSSNGFSSLKSPIPLDAIQAMSIELSPYDVRRAGFTGALMNVVTKSGTNTFRGSAYYEYTDQDWRAKNPVTGVKETFREYTQGLTFGGPIVKDKVFFFLSYEDFERLASPPQANFVPDATQLAAIVARAKALGYTAGDLNASNLSFQKTTIAKVDWNIVPGHRLTMTYRKNEGQTTSFQQYTGSTNTSLSDLWYANPRKTESYNAQLNSQWTSDLRTEFTWSHTDYNGSPRPGSGTAFPQVQVQGLTGKTLNNNATITNGAIYFGTDSSRQLNKITTKENQLKFSTEYSLGAHTLTAGVEDIQTKYTNAFVQFTYGNYTFASPATWNAGTPPTAFQLALPYPGFAVNDAIARFTYNAYGLFLQDNWHVNRNLTILGGLRFDYPELLEKPKTATGFSAAGFMRDNGSAVARNDTTNSGNWTLAPRVGFIFTPEISRKTQVRGGVGLFQGKTPAVYISNAYSNAGATASVTATPAQLPSITFSPDVNKQPVPAGTLAAASINVTDPKFVQPALWKSNLAIDHNLPFGNLMVTAEIYFDKVYEGLSTEFLNYQVAPTGPNVTPDGRIRYNGTITSSTAPVFTGRRRNANFADVFYMTNTTRGESRGFTLSLSRPMRDNWASSISWTQGHATEVSPSTSSTASSNYSLRASFNPNEDVASTSNTDIPNRIVGQFTKRFNFIKSFPTTVSFIAQARTGHPYSWVFRGDANGDGFAFNDLLYVPTGPTDPKVTWASTTERDNFFAFVDSTSLAKYKGGHPGRNSEYSPWVKTLDIKISQEVPIYRRLKGEIYLNILNIGNMVNSDWGLNREVVFSYRRGVASATSYNPAGNGGQGSWAYNYATSGATTLDAVPITANDYPISRWQVQGGLRVRF
ncbi:MAG: hypothetical protein EXS38_04275 [Opitutus sp.]|nr:hypothetical protein [Opitutus sp.]